MNHMPVFHRQRGVTLIVGLIMLVLITLMVTSAFMLSNTNLKSVGNMQFRDEAIAAANVALERVVSADFTLVPLVTTHAIDIDNDGTSNEYTVIVSQPTCIKSLGITTLPATDPDYVKCTVAAGNPSICFDTVWELSANVSALGAALATGAAATVKQGVAKRVNITAASSCG